MRDVSVKNIANPSANISNITSITPKKPVNSANAMEIPADPLMIRSNWPTFDIKSKLNGIRYSPSFRRTKQAGSMSGEIWGDLWSSNQSAFARRYMTTVVEKETLVCLAADLRTMDEISALIAEVGPYIACLKLHVDIVNDWNIEGWMRICNEARSQGVAIWEDRKFADIGRVSRQQMAGAFDIRSWADIVTAHLISGPDIIQGLQDGWSDVERDGGVLLLAQMSSRGNLLDEKYTKTVVNLGNKEEGVLGYIGNGSDPSAIQALREIVGSNRMIWTPGINLTIGDGVAGQRYGHPREAVLAGSDCLIVGSGIHQSQDRRVAAAEYARISWQALLDR